MRWLILWSVASVWIGAEEVFPIQVQHRDPLFAGKVAQRLSAIAIDNGEQDELILVMPQGGIYEFAAELRVGQRIVPLQVHDLLFSGIRLKVGDAFTKGQKESMILMVTSAILK